MSGRRNLFLLSVLALGAISANPNDETRIKQRIEQIQGSDTNTWRQIPWTSSLLEAVCAGQREKKPIFVFTHDGNIETGRC